MKNILDTESKVTKPSHPGPRIIPRSEHSISRSAISENALKVLYRLKNAGFQSYLVGGSVRDLMLGREPKDFDVATDAHPEEIQELFSNCRLIGRRFRLAHIRFRNEIIEVATFRGGDAGIDDDQHHENGRILRDNVYGTRDQDAWRRDFTVNALFYDIRDFSVVDHVDGVGDIDKGVIRIIGDPVTRYHEDPVRMLRAIRFAAKLGFRIHSDTAAPIHELGHLLEGIPAARLFDEILKLFHGGAAAQSFEMLRQYGLFKYLFPYTEEALLEDAYPHAIELLGHGLSNTDKRIANDQPVTPAFLFAVLLWPAMYQRRKIYIEEGMTELQAILIAGREIAKIQSKRTTLPKRFSIPMREIWGIQPRLRHLRGKRPLRLLGHQRFRAAYDFLLLRNSAGEELQELCEWWTSIQEVEQGKRKEMTRTRSSGNRKGRPRNRR